MEEEKCTYCESTHIDVDTAAGELICMDCGAILEQNRLVNNMTFQEVGNARGVVGQTVSKGEESTKVQIDNRGKLFFGKVCVSQIRKFEIRILRKKIKISKPQLLFLFL